MLTLHLRQCGLPSLFILPIAMSSRWIQERWRSHTFRRNEPKERLRRATESCGECSKIYPKTRIAIIHLANPKCDSMLGRRTVQYEKEI